MKYAVHLTEEALDMLVEIQDRRVRQKIRDRIEKLEEDPDKQGKTLWDDLAGYRSVRAVGQRYRIVYEVKEDTVKVIVIGVGIRKDGDKNDIYAKLTGRSIKKPDPEKG
ncbi:MAG: type II toxin-antitoxin system RelE/ParE family toxin [Holophaga sp.]|nr:type II toxin-antitoxin system RelE/ParE family toxin [Holophaga sp.]